MAIAWVGCCLWGANNLLENRCGATASGEWEGLDLTAKKQRLSMQARSKLRHWPRAMIGMPTGVAIGGDSKFEKALGAALIDGHALLSLDNMEQSIQGQLLCQILSQQRAEVRVLGRSKMTRPSTPTGAMPQCTKHVG